MLTDRRQSYAPHLAILMAGIAVGALSGSRRKQDAPTALGAPDAPAAKELRRSLAELERRLARQEQATAAQLSRIDARLDEHAAKLATIPSTKEIVAGIEQLLSTTLVALEQRVAAQAASVEALKSAVSQTDSFLERALESPDCLLFDTTSIASSRDAAIPQVPAQAKVA